MKIGTNLWFAIRGSILLLIVLSIFLSGCTNPFFEYLLKQETEETRDQDFYTVRFFLNDGTDAILAEVAASAVVSATASAAAPAMASMTASMDAPVTVSISQEDFPADPERVGYTFAGWNTEADGDGEVFTVSTTVSADLMVYAQWDALVYTVSFKGNYGTDETLYTRVLSFPAETVGDFPAGPVRSGYVFGGWNTAADGKGKTFTASTVVSADLTVYAQWVEVKAGSYTVIFKMNDGTDAIWSLEVVTPPSEDLGVLPAAPTRPGYGFMGWNTEKDGNGTAFTASTAVSADLTAYAQWAARTYTVNFERNDGTDVIWDIKTVTVPDTMIDRLPPSPTWEGYGFRGWNTEKDGSGTGFARTSPVTGDMTVYAQWSAGIYTVTFERNDGTDEIWAAREVAVPDTMIDSLPDNPDRLGYDFSGWNTALDGSGTGFARTTPVNGDLVVYAQWSPQTYTVIFKNNDGTNAIWDIKTVTVPAATIDSLPSANPTRTGYGFRGWTTTEEGGTAFTAATEVTGDMTVFAQWSAGIYTVTFKTNYGTDAVLYTKTVIVPDTMIDSLPDNPDRTGYAFRGWNTEKDGSGTGFARTTPVTGDMTVYAQWVEVKPGSYMVSFMLNDGTNAIWDIKTVTLPAATIDSLPSANPTRTGYGFRGWTTAAEGGTAFTAATEVTGDMTVYAQWSAGIYTVTFKSNYGIDAALYTKTVVVPDTMIDSLPDNPDRPGYGFRGWNTEKDGSGTGFARTTPVTGDMTVYAQWVEVKPGSYMVSFMLNDGTNAIWATKTVTVPDTMIDSLPDNPTRPGYDFEGWTTTAEGGTAFTAVSADLTVYAQWDPRTYTVTFKSNYETNETLYTKTVTVPDTMIDDLPPAPNRGDDYAFRGWNTEMDGSGTGFVLTTPVNGDMTVYAQWDPRAYTVTFKSNYGINETLYTKTVTVPADTIDSLPDIPTRQGGYIFSRWNTAPDGGGTDFTLSTTVNSDITVYAQWAGSYAITLNPDAGTGAFSEPDFSVSKTGSPQTKTIRLTGSGYSNPRWEVDGILRGTGSEITINAADYVLGRHNLTLIITKNGTLWSRELSFTVEG